MMCNVRPAVGLLVLTWAAFAGTDADAMVAGDVAMLDHEVTPVLKALRSHGIDVVAIHLTSPGQSRA